MKMFWIFQLDALRKNVDMDGNAVEDNYRPTQGLNARTVYHHQPAGPCFHTGSYPASNTRPAGPVAPYAYASVMPGRETLTSPEACQTLCQVTNRTQLCNL